MNLCDRCHHAESSHRPGIGCVDCPVEMRCTSYKVPFPSISWRAAAWWLEQRWTG